MYDIAVCDDSTLDRERLIERINCVTAHELRIHEFSSGEELLEAMNNIRFSAIFLDIQMKGMSGDVTAKRIRELDSTLVLVFYTGVAAPTPERIEVLPFRYIVKNMPSTQFDEYVKATLDKAAECRSMPTLAAIQHRNVFYVNSKYIIYIEKYNKNTRAELVPSAYRTYGIKADTYGKYPNIRIPDTLENIYGKLKQYGFGCPHSSYIINFEYMNTCTSKLLKLDGVDTEFPITRSKVKEFNELKGRFIRAKYVRLE